MYPVSLFDTAKCLLLCCILFAGPLYEMVVVDGEWRDWSPDALSAAVWNSWIGYRNLIVGPVSEELVFRAFAISLFLLTDVSLIALPFLPAAHCIFSFPNVGILTARNRNPQQQSPSQHP